MVRAGGVMPSGRADEVRDYTFADQALTLRKRAGLTQRDLAALLRVSAQSIRAWEAGLSSPGTEHLKALIALYWDRATLMAGREEEEAAALWATVRERASRRMEPFDRAWFAALRGATAIPARQCEWGEGAVARGSAPCASSTPARIAFPRATPAAPAPAPRSPPEPWPMAADRPDQPPTNLPAARASFVGRSGDLAMLRQALDPMAGNSARLLTVTGVAGCGKTRLALSIADTVLNHYGDGVWLVELASLPASASAEPSAVLRAILTVLGLHEQPNRVPLDTLIAHLQPRRLLLVLDNCEHVVNACAALVPRLLDACPGLQILATSQIPLGLAGETVWRVTALTLPDAVAGAPTEAALALLEQSEAVQLFVQRAQAVQPRFTLDAATAASVAAICRQLDGLPLALELAAARLNVLPVAEIRARLKDRFRLLRRDRLATYGRHQALQAAMDWSYGLLEPAAQGALRRLAVFAGGWDLAAAEAVCADETVAVASVLEVLDELLARSLVYVQEVDGVSRYGMLETVRQYGLQQLERGGELAAVCDRHLDWCLTLAEESVPSLRGATQEEWLARLEREHDNLRAALRWSLGAGAFGSGALRLAGALARFWLMHAHLSEGRQWLGEALAAEGGTASERARAFDGAGLLAEGQGAYEEATRLLEESLALWREAGDPAGTALALADLGIVAEKQGDYARARAQLEEALALFRGLGAREELAGTLNTLGLVVQFQGDARTAWALLQESLTLFRALRDGWGVANTLGHLAIAARRKGEYTEALALYEEALTGARALGDRRGVARWLNGLALSLASRGEHDRAQALLEESLALSRAQRDRTSAAESLNDLGEIARNQGAHDRARGLFEESLALHLQVGNGRGIANAYRNLAGMAEREGDHERGAELLAKSLELYQGLGDRWGIAQCLELGGRVAAGRERWAAAAQLLAGADALRRVIDTHLDPYELDAHEDLLRIVRTTLGEAGFSPLWASGRALPLDDLLARCIAVVGPGSAAETDEGIRSHAEPHSHPTPVTSPPRPPTNLPHARTSFVGRTRDLASLVAALDPAASEGARLLTLVGVAGCGKTRLSLAAAEGVRDIFGDGIWLVELAPVPASLSPDPAGVAVATLSAMGLQEQPGNAPVDTLIAHLQARRLLLLLDNCEHVVTECAALATRLLAACPELRILATSQQSLGLANETIWRVGPLLVPPRLEGAPAPEALHLLWQSEAVQLFVERAQAVRPTFALSAENAAAVAAICRQLDGLPLAIELAAARLHVLPLEEVHARLDDRFRLLRRGGRNGADRHLTLQATLDWSYGLLDPASQAVLRRLAVFVGGWEVVAAEAVCAGEDLAADGVLDLLDELLDRSLVYVHEAGGIPRYGMLETVRQYGLLQLERTGEAATVREQHLRWCVSLAKQAAPALAGPEQAAWLARLEREHDNLRAALQWALDRGMSARSLELVAGLWRFWRGHRRHLSEGRRWLAAILALPAEKDNPSVMALRASALEGAAWLAEDEHDFSQAAALFAESGAALRALGRDERTPRPLINEAMEARARGDYAQATRLLEESLASHRALGNRERITHGGLGLSLSRLALVLAEQGEYTRAAGLYEECVALHRELGDREGLAYALLGLADIARDQGDTERIGAYCGESLAIFRELGHTLVGFALNNLALAAYLDGDLALAGRRAGESEAFFRQLQAEPNLAEVLITVGRVKAARGEAATARASLAEALMLAWGKGPRWVVAAALEELGVLAVRQGHVRYGVELLAGAATQRQAMGAPVRPADRPALEGTLAAARTALGSAAFADAWATGHALSAEQIVAHASAAPEEEPATPERDGATRNARTGA